MTLRFLPDNRERQELAKLDYAEAAYRSGQIIRQVNVDPSVTEITYILQIFESATLINLREYEPKTRTVKFGNAETQYGRTPADIQNSATQLSSKIERLKPFLQEILDFLESPLAQKIQIALNQGGDFKALLEQLDQEIQERTAQGKETKRFGFLKIQLERKVTGKALASV